MATALSYESGWFGGGVRFVDGNRYPFHVLIPGQIIYLLVEFLLSSCPGLAGTARSAKIFLCVRSDLLHLVDQAIHEGISYIDQFTTENPTSAIMLFSSHPCNAFCPRAMTMFIAFRGMVSSSVYEVASHTRFCSICPTC